MEGFMIIQYPLEVRCFSGKIGKKSWDTFLQKQNRTAKVIHSTPVALKLFFFVFLFPLEQEQTKFDDLRRGFTEDFKRCAKFKRTLSKGTKKVTDFVQIGVE